MVEKPNETEIKDICIICKQPITIPYVVGVEGKHSHAKCWAANFYVDPRQERMKKMEGCPSVVDVHKVKGYRPNFNIYIGRKVVDTEFTIDSKWHNPFTISKWGQRSLPMFEQYITALLEEKWILWGKEGFSEKEVHAMAEALKEARRNWNSWDIDDLTGMQLGCWCVTTKRVLPLYCHGQILIKIWLAKHGMIHHE